MAEANSVENSVPDEEDLVNDKHPKKDSSDTPKKDDKTTTKKAKKKKKKDTKGAIHP